MQHRDLTVVEVGMEQLFSIKGTQKRKGAYVIVALTLLSALASGCSKATIVHVHGDASFDYSNAASGEVGIAGFTSSVGSEEDRDALERNLPPLLAQSLQEQWPDIKILSPERIREALGPEVYRVMFDSYADVGSLDELDLEELSFTLQDLVQYVVVGRVDYDEISQSSDESEDSLEIRTSYYTSRSIGVSLKVYDLRIDEMVFCITLANGKTNSRYETEDVFGASRDESFIDGCVRSCMTDIIDDILSDKSDGSNYPVPPSDEEITKDVFKKFSESLPQDSAVG
jgi:hypothetical protein